MSKRVQAVLEKIDWRSFSGMSHIHGFNYQPSWGRDAASVWLEKFDPKQYRNELSNGKKYFPKFNCVRIWLGYGAYKKDAKLFLRNFREAVDICAELELLVMPVLFTVWQGDPPFDPIILTDLVGANLEERFGPYLRDVVVAERQNRTILAWDLCNEPNEGSFNSPILQQQAIWLKFAHDCVKSIDPQAKTCIGTVADVGWGQTVAEFCDVLTPHMYGYPAWKVGTKNGQVRADFDTWFECSVDQYVVSWSVLSKPKPILSTETCWGCRDDAERKRIIQVSLDPLRRHGIGFLAHALYSSGVADLHIPENYNEWLTPGTPNPATMEFIRMDGRLRPGHEVFNDYC
jgi:hypothetical protein